MRHKENGVWRATSWDEWDRASREIAGGLVDAGVAVGEPVIILANTRPEWLEADVGILMAGGITVPIYPSNTPEQCEYIINDCGAKMLIVEDPHQLEKLFDEEISGKLDHIERVIYMSDHAVMTKKDARGRTEVPLSQVEPLYTEGWKEKIISLGELRAKGEAWLANNDGKLAEIAADIDPGQPVTFVYTSGTTGPPKGVVLTHSNLVFECHAIREGLGLTTDDEQLLFLPLAHIFAKLLEWGAIEVGYSTAFAESVPKLIDNMKEIQPTFMGAVPRVYEKAYVKIQANLEEKKKKPIPRMLINWALKKGMQRSKRLRQGKPAPFLSGLADKLVFKKVQETFGGRIKFFISGGAPLSGEIAEFLHAAGILVLEGYGLTETTAATHLNRPNDYAFGTVGPPLLGVEVKIAEADGEILVRGGNIMKEYFGKPEATAEVLEDDGWFHTGDIGVIEPGGHLRITDRKKDIIVTAGGKNVAPQNIEGHLKAHCPYVSQVMVYGDKRKFLSALITLNEETLVPWAAEQGIASGELAELSEHEQVKALIDRAVKNLNADLASYETIKKYEILPHDFTQETGELTPTLKVKRKFCTQKYQDILDGFYDGLKSGSI
jgi:long-chain acyl-CoA synthetase